MLQKKNWQHPPTFLRVSQAISLRFEDQKILPFLNLLMMQFVWIS